MVAVELDHIQFWQPPELSPYQHHTFPRKRSKAASATRFEVQPVAATQQQGSGFEAQQTQGCINDPINYDRNADETFPSIEKLLDPCLQKEIAASGCQGTRDRPLILKEDAGDAPNYTADSEVTLASANAGPVPDLDSSQRANPFNHEPWWDVEAGCFVDEDLHPLPSLDHECLALTLAQVQPPSRRNSLGSAAQSLFITLDQDGGRDSEEHVLDLERDMQPAFEEQEELLVTSPSSQRARCSIESSHPPTDKYCDRGRSADLRFRRLFSQDEEDSRQEEKMAADEKTQEVLEQGMETGDDEDDDGKREQRGETRQHQDRGNHGIHHPESSGHEDANDEDEEDENPRSMYRPRLFLASADMPSTPPLEKSSRKLYLSRPYNMTPLSTAQLEITSGKDLPRSRNPPDMISSCSRSDYNKDSSDESEDDDYGRDSNDKDDTDFQPMTRSKIHSPPLERYRSLRVPVKTSNVQSKHSCHHLSEAHDQSRSPPISQNPPESIPLAEYHEYSVNGAFKCHRIENTTTLILELQVDGLPEDSEFTPPFRVMGSALAAVGTASESQRSRSHVTPRSPQCNMQRPKKRGRQWTAKEESIVVNMRKRNASWRAICAAVPTHPPGSVTGHYFGKLCKRD